MQRIIIYLFIYMFIIIFSDYLIKYSLIYYNSDAFLPKYFVRLIESLVKPLPIQ